MASFRSTRMAAAISGAHHLPRLIAPAPLAVAALPEAAPQPTPAEAPVPAHPAPPETAAAIAAISPTQEPRQPMENTAGIEPVPGSPEALALLAALGIAPRAAAGASLGPDDERFSPIAIAHLSHRLVEVKLLLDQLAAEQKALHESLRLAHLRGDLLHLLPPGLDSGYQLPGGVQLHRRAGRRQWYYGPEVQELEAQLKAQQVYEQTNGQAVWSLGTAFWELRFPKG